MDEIREELTMIVTNYQKSDSHSLSQIHDVSQRLLSQCDGREKSVERLYVLYYLCEIVSHLAITVSQNEAQQFMKILFPTETLSQRQANLMSQLIALALSVTNEQMLTCVSHYLLTCDRISLSNISSITLSNTLANDSPSFCAALISKGYFSSLNKSMLTQWLCTLNNSPQETCLTLNSCIRYSLLEGQIDSNLHLSILSIISQRKCQTLSNQFLIDIATVISQRTNNGDLIDRLAQIIIVANASGMCTLTNQVKSILISKFPFNKLMTSI